MSLAPKSYVGDGVYAELDDYGAIVLTTEDGIRATNTIVLEPEVWESLKRYAAAAYGGLRPGGHGEEET